MSPQRFATLGALGGTVVLAGWVVAGLAGFGSPGIENTDRAPIEERATSLTVDAEPASTLQATTIINKTSIPDVAVAATEPDQREPAVVSAAVPATVANTAIVEAASLGLSPMPPPEGPVQVATVSTPDPVQSDAQGTVRSSETLGSLETLDECLVADTCIDQYLWSAYQRTPKRDTAKMSEKKKVIVKKNGKTRTVVKTITKLVEGGRKSRHVDDGLRNRRHGSKLQDQALSCASGDGRSRACAGNHERVPRRLPSIDRQRPPEGRVQRILSWRELARRLWPRACRRSREC